MKNFTISRIEYWSETEAGPVSGKCWFSDGKNWFWKWNEDAQDYCFKTPKRVANPARLDALKRALQKRGDLIFPIAGNTWD